MAGNAGGEKDGEGAATTGPGDAIGAEDALTADAEGICGEGIVAFQEGMAVEGLAVAAVGADAAAKGKTEGWRCSMDSTKTGRARGIGSGTGCRKSRMGSSKKEISTAGVTAGLGSERAIKRTKAAQDGGAKAGRNLNGTTTALWHRRRGKLAGFGSQAWWNLGFQFGTKTALSTITVWKVTDNLRHFAGGLYWGKTGTTLQTYLSDVPQQWGEDDPDRRAESQAEIEANTQAGSASNSIENQLGKYAPWYVEDEESDEAWAMVKMMVGQQWRSRFCKPQE